MHYHYRLFIATLFAAMIITPPSVHGGMEKLKRAKRSVRVTGMYFVHMNERITIDEIRELISEYENMNNETFVLSSYGILDEVAHGFSCKMSKQALDEVLDNDMVDQVDEDHYIHGASDRERVVFTWGLDRLDQTTNEYDSKYTAPCNLTGEGADVYVLDSGIWYPHDEFDGKAVYVGCDPIDQLTGTNRSGLDCTGHGSHVAGTIVGKSMGVAPGATVISVRILDCNDMGSASSVLLGIECVLKKYKERKRPAVVNLSVYGEKDLKIKRAIDGLMEAGITVVSIAGNNDVQKPRDACKLSPGSIHGVITASASTKEDEAYSGSNVGLCVDLYAPGTEINSATHLCNKCRSVRRGSSMAAPHVSGAVALLLQMCPSLPPWKVKHLLLSQMVLSNKLDFSKVTRKYQSVTPNLLLHTSSLQCDIQCN